MKFKQWWTTTKFYKWLQTFQHEVVLLEEKKGLLESTAEEDVKEVTRMWEGDVEIAEAWFEKAMKEEEKWKDRGIEFYGKFANRTMEEQNQNLTSAIVDKAEPTELEKVVTSLQSHVDNLTTKLGSISEVAKKLNPTGFSSLVTNSIGATIMEGTDIGIIEVIKKYITDAEILAENIEAVAGFIKKQV